MTKARLQSEQASRGRFLRSILRVKSHQGPCRSGIVVKELSRGRPKLVLRGGGGNVVCKCRTVDFRVREGLEGYLSERERCRQYFGTWKPNGRELCDGPVQAMLCYEVLQQHEDVRQTKVSTTPSVP
ncbi:hypothetical protein ES702_07138 [subsurface metagenome]